MHEHPFFFHHGRHRLFGVLHEAVSRRRRLGFVFCHPFAEEKLWAHRVFVAFARELAERGHPVLRFDYMGNGDSEGAFRETSVATAEQDVARAIEVLQERTGLADVALLGLRLGATIARRVAQTRRDVPLVVLWSPIIQGDRYAQDFLRANLTSQMALFGAVQLDRPALVESMKQGATVNVEGYEIALPMYEQLTAVNLDSETTAFAGDCLVVQIERAPGAKPLTTLQRLAARCRHGELAIVQEEPFWREIERFYERAPVLADTTLQWLDRQPIALALSEP